MILNEILQWLAIVYIIWAVVNLTGAVETILEILNKK